MQLDDELGGFPVQHREVRLAVIHVLQTFLPLFEKGFFEKHCISFAFLTFAC